MWAVAACALKAQAASLTDACFKCQASDAPTRWLPRELRGRLGDALAEGLGGGNVAEFVNPAASFSFYCCVNHGLDDASANFLNCQLAPPM
jgi:hypothetical protein